jgi:hypothetical protein
MRTNAADIAEKAFGSFSSNKNSEEFPSHRESNKESRIIDCQLFCHSFATLNLDNDEMTMMTTTATSKAPLATATIGTGSVELSDYEVQRARNIERNNARLRALGLISTQEEKVSNAIAWKTKVSQPTTQEMDAEESADEDEYIDSGSPQKSRKRKARKSDPELPSRKSSRLQGLQPEVGSDEITSATTTTTNSNKEHRQERVEECRLARQENAVRIAATVGGAAQAAKENPTATYEHCLMRVRTMTEKALERRVNAIEKAIGKHCVVKMAIFKSCLQDEGMWHLAELAEQALERLKALLPPPVE